MTKNVYLGVTGVYYLAQQAVTDVLHYMPRHLELSFYTNGTIQSKHMRKVYL